MIVPIESLQPDTISALIEEFVTRTGAIHGHIETSTEEKAAAVLRQLRSGVAVIVFDEESESVSIVMKDDLTGDPEES